MGRIALKRFKEIVLHLLRGMSKAVLRFPLAVLSLAGTAGLICYMIISSRDTFAGH
jgi:hypothetical protein